MLRSQVLTTAVVWQWFPAALDSQRASTNGLQLQMVYLEDRTSREQPDVGMSPPQY